MGEPAIPTDADRERAIDRAREILQAIRDDDEQCYPRFPVTDRLSSRRREASENNQQLDRVMWLLASALDQANTALARACDIADALNGDNGDDDELERRRKEIAELRTFGVPVKFCAHCNAREAACVGRYEDHAKEDCPYNGCTQHEESPACDECCGHANEDGHCREIDHPAILLELKLA